MHSASATSAEALFVSYPRGMRRVLSYLRSSARGVRRPLTPQSGCPARRTTQGAATVAFQKRRRLRAPRPVDANGPSTLGATRRRPAHRVHRRCSGNTERRACVPRARGASPPGCVRDRSNASSREQGIMSSGQASAKSWRVATRELAGPIAPDLASLPRHEKLPATIERLIPPPNDSDLRALAELLVDAVESGAAVSFLAPLTLDRAEECWRRTISSSHPRSRSASTEDSRRYRLLPSNDA